MRSLRWLSAVVFLLFAAAAATYVAGEQVEVAVLRTRDADGGWRDTRLWVVDHLGVPWVRVANPERQWFQRLLREPRAELVRDGVAQPVIARVRDSGAARALIDARFREKYGAVDWWYGVLLRRGPVPVRLDPVVGSSGAHREPTPPVERTATPDGSTGEPGR